MAFAKESALDELALDERARSGMDLAMVVGTDFQLTELELLHRFDGIDRADLRVRYSLGDRTFHPKVYLVERGAKQIAYVGSANFTRGGLRRNVEAAVRLEGSGEDAPIVQAHQLFRRWADSPLVVPLDAEFEEQYQLLQELRRSALRDAGSTVAERRLHYASTSTLVGQRVAEGATAHFLVANEQNFRISMRRKRYGFNEEKRARRLRRGDLFVYHVTGHSRLFALGFVASDALWDDSDLWRADSRGRGNYPWRVRLQPLVVLRFGLRTAEVLGVAPAYIRGLAASSHSLRPEEFLRMREAILAAHRDEVEQPTLV